MNSGLWLYALYGALVLGLAGTAEYRGWGLWRVTSTQTVPLSIRDNPGASRALYRPSPRSPGGK